MTVEINVLCKECSYKLVVPPYMSTVRCGVCGNVQKINEEVQRMKVSAHVQERVVSDEKELEKDILDLITPKKDIDPFEQEFGEKNSLIPE